ncbi:MAG TPA: carbon monoxide dehydrogenase subunit G [bacterium]|nr:carbon monoxide dehydrogenase subunit G [bacterium]
MKLDGTNSLPAPVETVWTTLNDPEVLRRCTPGLKELTAKGPDSYAATLSIGIAAVKGTYAGTLTITDKQAPTHYKIVLEGTGGAGFMKGVGTVDLEAQGGGTLLRWTGDIQVGGLIAGVGQRMLSGVGKMLIGQFFKCLEQQFGAAPAPGGSASGQASSPRGNGDR